MDYLCEEFILAFIRLADVIINIDYIAAVRFSTYNGSSGSKEIPVVTICLAIPEGSFDGEIEPCSGKCQGCQSIEKLEYESDLAIAIWNYFSQSSDVTVLFE
ncbi:MULTISPECIES: hypothetical protein [unclassified Coleofasciculus]|uniref:hypothetical protein n=1 Tax=unclassified Coleofasciculus TaxID=2692782 RepID=UPI00188251F2|nr:MULTISPECIES: hypothetical protein [unclassified Coleofasciculus]MBE9125863.1 hypothetical protein [Coleofasciculus sp. LEGE 07081]MBE9149182.1 hypothetical protein [Coleofasciculus sp. LEGE 07092]